MKFKRAAGIILHPTSLPGPYGIGDIGPQAYRWLEFLNEAGCGLWQVLPLGPTGYGDSPYQCFSAFAGNPYLISPELLLEEGLLTRSELQDHPYFTAGHVNYGAVIPWKVGLLDRAFERFSVLKSGSLLDEFEKFQDTQASWLDDYLLFMAIKSAQGGGSWANWPKPLRNRQPEALKQARLDLSTSIRSHAFRQFMFYRQWRALKERAEKLGILIIGDIPIFVAHDSADVWSHIDLFYMDKDSNLTVVAGVPPDYFSPTGQLWGNPLYKWDVHKKTGYAWWLSRFRTVLQSVDIVRLDHFRGFAGYWEVKAGSPTAQEGQWVPGPSKDFLRAVRDGLGELPIIAEDLGIITPDVEELRDSFNLPGMKVLQFAFANDPSDAFLPHNYPVNCVAYTGTHDNDTSVGWFATAGEKERSLLKRYLNTTARNVAWDMARSIWRSSAMFTLAPMQDFLHLGSRARMNFPGKAAGNWSWRMRIENLSDKLCADIREMNYLYSREK